MSEGINRSDRQGSVALAAAQETPMDRLDSTAVPIAGEVFHVGELSLDQVIAIARLLGEATVRMTEKEKAVLQEIASRTRGPQADGKLDQLHANVVAFMEVLDRKTIAAVFGALLDREEEWVRRNLKLRATLQVVGAVLEHNDPEELKAAFFEVKKHLPPSLTSWLRGLPSSPPTVSRKGKSGGTRSAGSRR